MGLFGSYLSVVVTLAFRELNAAPEKDAHHLSA
jgi:hypothetical protein